MTSYNLVSKLIHEAQFIDLNVVKNPCKQLDNEEMARAIIAQMISNHNELKLAQEFSNAMQAIKYLNQNLIITGNYTIPSSN